VKFNAINGSVSLVCSVLTLGPGIGNVLSEESYRIVNKIVTLNDGYHKKGK
jgi:hypothetical protein